MITFCLICCSLSSHKLILYGEDHTDKAVQSVCREFSRMGSISLFEENSNEYHLQEARNPLHLRYVHPWNRNQICIEHPLYAFVQNSIEPILWTDRSNLDSFTYPWLTLHPAQLADSKISTVDQILQTHNWCESIDFIRKRRSILLEATRFSNWHIEMSKLRYKYSVNIVAWLKEKDANVFQEIHEDFHLEKSFPTRLADLEKKSQLMCDLRSIKFAQGISESVRKGDLVDPCLVICGFDHVKIVNAKLQELGHDVEIIAHSRAIDTQKIKSKIESCIF